MKINDEIMIDIKLLLILVLLTFSKTSFADIIISDNFSKDKLHQYDQSHIAFCNFNCGSYKAYEFLKEKNGNEFIRLTSRLGQLSKFNSNHKKYLKDRIELGTKRNKLSKSWSDLDNKEIWWSFDVKLPPNFTETNAKEISITQLKTIEKNYKKKQCHPGMPFRINYNEKYTWIAVTDGFNNKLMKKEFFKNILNNNWTNFKIGYHFSKKNGWVKVYKNGEIILNYLGNTIFDEYNCKPVSDLQTYVRIGIYRGTNTNDSKSKSHKERSDSLDFDNFSVCIGAEKKCK
jgi:hypothetical protein